jgi:CRISPR-associated protein Csd1
LLGLEEKNGMAKRHASCEKHLKILADCTGDDADALRAFFKQDDVTESLSDASRTALAKGGNCVLVVDGTRYAHTIPELIDAWNLYINTKPNNQIGQCSITGKTGRLARLFPEVTGIPGVTAGAKLVSFNHESFESYGKKQSYNASLSEEAAFGAGTALKYLFKDSRHHVRLGNVTVVFWADRAALFEDAFMLELLGGVAYSAEDEETRQLVAASLQNIRFGKPLTGLDTTVKYYVLGITPNDTRLVVRFFEIGTLGDLAENYGWFLRDIDIKKDVKHNRQITSLLALLRQTAPMGRAENLPAPLVNPCFNSLLHGSGFPLSLETTLLSRMRADHGYIKKKGNKKPEDVMTERASLMKAYLVRKTRLLSLQPTNNESEVNVALNCSNNNVGYVLGRLFAVMERAQQGAQGSGLNSTIRDKYMSSAATTPSRVYGILLGLCQKHLGSMRREENKKWLAQRIEKELEQIFDLLTGREDSVPATLNSDDQLMFYVGYYQERVELWSKPERDDNQVQDGGNEEE